MLCWINRDLRKKVQRLRNVYNYKDKQVTVSLLLLVCVFTFFSCKTKEGFPVTYEPEVKSTERDGARIDSLEVKIIKKLPNGDYVVEYSILGQITPEYWHSHLTLKKIRLIEKDGDSSMFDRHIVLTPVQCYFFGKAAVDPLPFRITNDYVVKNNLEKPIKKILFSSGDKNYLLELP